MDFETLRDRLETACEYPVDQDQLLDEVGSVEVESGSESTETVQTVLQRTDETTYQSPSDVYNAIRGSLEASYVGRRGYDDRGGAAPTHDEKTL